MSMQNQNTKTAQNPELVILVVEDHMLFTKDVKHALPSHSVIFAHSLEDAKERYNECLPNIIFLDIDLPDGSGFELLDYILSGEPDAYVVILTGSKIERDRLTSQQKGARGYIIKPTTKSKIENHISEYLMFREQQIKSLLMEIEKHRKEDLIISTW